MPSVHWTIDGFPVEVKMKRFKGTQMDWISLLTQLLNPSNEAGARTLVADVVVGFAVAVRAAAVFY